MMKKILPLILAATLALPLMGQVSKTEPSKSSSPSEQKIEQERKLGASVTLTEAELDAIINEAVTTAIDEVNAQWTSSDEKKRTDWGNERSKLNREAVALARERDAWKTGAFVAGGAAVSLLLYEGVRALVNSLKQ